MSALSLQPDQGLSYNNTAAVTRRYTKLSLRVVKIKQVRNLVYSHEKKCILQGCACVPVVAGPHAPGRGEGVEGLIGYLGDIFTIVVVGVRGKDGAKCCKVDDTMTHPPGNRK